MLGPFAVKLQKPDLSAPSDWNGYITTVYQASVTRGINRAGTFNVTFPMSADQARLVTRGWYVSLLHERIGEVKSDGSAFTPPAMLYQGRVLRRTPVVEASGAVTMVLDGETFMGQLADHWIQTETTYTNQTLDQVLTSILGPLGISYTVPTRCTTETLTVKFSDLTVLQALIRLAELSRTNLVDTFVNSIRFTDQNDLQDPLINVNVDDPVVRLINVETVTPDMRNAAYAGFGILSEPPTVSWDGSELANKIKVIGVDFDGNQLDLAGATGTDPAFPVTTTTYSYVEDPISQAIYGTVEMQIIRSDMKNPSDDPATRAATRACLLAVANGELLRRRSEILTMQLALLNGEDIWALPGDKVWVRYKGKAYLRDGTFTVVDVDQWMLVNRRIDESTTQGQRRVGLDVTTPLLAYRDPDLPAAVAIPTPEERQQAPDRTSASSVPCSASDSGQGDVAPGPIHWDDPVMQAGENRAYIEGLHAYRSGQPVSQDWLSTYGPKGGVKNNPSSPSPASSSSSGGVSNGGGSMVIGAVKGGENLDGASFGLGSKGGLGIGTTGGGSSSGGGLVAAAAKGSSDGGNIASASGKAAMGIGTTGGGGSSGGGGMVAAAAKGGGGGGNIASSSGKAAMGIGTTGGGGASGGMVAAAVKGGGGGGISTVGGGETKGGLSASGSGPTPTTTSGSSSSSASSDAPCNDTQAALDPGLVKHLMEQAQNEGELQPCCADPQADVGGNPSDDNGVNLPKQKPFFTVHTPSGDFSASSMQQANSVIKGMGGDTSAYSITAGSQPVTSYNVETPGGVTNVPTLAAAISALAALGVDYRNTPYGYDIIQVP